MRNTVFVIVVTAIACTASFAVQIDGTTSQQWTFSTDASPASPESIYNPYGSANAVIDYAPLGTGWYDTMPDVYGSAQGWWDIAVGSITLTVPNRPNAGPRSYKDIQVRVKYWNGMSAAPDVQVSPSAAFVGKTSTLVEQVGIGAWWVDVWLLHMEPNPDLETIRVIGDQDWGSQIDEITVDTVCTIVPEPGSLAVLLTAVGGGFVVRRRRD